MNNNVVDQQALRDAAFARDEIDLFDLVDDIRSQKHWLFASVFACLLLAAGYILLSNPVYEVKSTVKPALERDVVALNVPQLEGIFKLDVTQAFDLTRQALYSREYRHRFYEANFTELKELGDFYDPALTDGQNFLKFDELFTEKNADPKKDSELFVEIKYESLSQEKAADLLNRYIAFALEQAQADVRSSVESKVAARLQQLDYDARELREKYYSEQLRRELLLKEANQIAKAVGQQNPVYATSDLVGGYQPPLYMFGTKAIEAEIRMINNRKDMTKNLARGEDNFITGLPEILLKTDELKSLKVDFEHVRLGIVDEKATKPRKSVKPKKALVLALAGVAGLMLGLMAALLVAAYKRRKQETNE
ncbi:MAG: hypothetical protein H7A08_08720 [Oceanospirillaceae bacterium]|nr:hypothetical protein [Oceanospirillaceae bacterium]